MSFSYKRVDEQGNERQYATAINVPTNQCEAGFRPSHDNFLTHENADDVKTDISNEQDPVYQGTELIAAGLKKMGKYYIHSERLLLNPTPERPVTPMQNLLNKGVDSCTILYSFNSPCADICLNLKNSYNVLKGLGTWSAHRSIKAFVFKQIWRIDAPRPDILRNALEKAASYAPLYRCVSDNECFSCGGRNNVPIDERCLTN